MHYENKAAKSSHFVTLTYADKYLPCNGKQRTFGTLNKKDVSLFVKRLRKKLFGSKKGDLKFFAVGEYGNGATQRPHYHLIIWNAHETAIRQSWQYGFTYCEPVTGGANRYCMKYIMKAGKINSQDKYERLPEFRTMSNGIGESYLTPGKLMYHWQDVINRYNVKLPSKDGNPLIVSMPRYYAQRIYLACDKDLIRQAAIDNSMVRVNEMVAHVDQHGWDHYKQLRKDHFDKGNQTIITEQKKRMNHEPAILR